MIPAQAVVEDAILDILRRTEPCTLDGLNAALPDYSWTQVFLAVDDLSRNGRLVLRHTSKFGYQLSIPSSCSSEKPSAMKGLEVRFCVGCGQVCDESDIGGRQPQWIDGHTYVLKHEVRWEDLTRIDSTCPPCAQVLASGRRGDRPGLVESATTT